MAHSPWVVTVHGLPCGTTSLAIKHYLKENLQGLSHYTSCQPEYDVIHPVKSKLLDNPDPGRPLAALLFENWNDAVAVSRLQLMDLHLQLQEPEILSSVSAKVDMSLFPKGAVVQIAEQLERECGVKVELSITGHGFQVDMARQFLERAMREFGDEGLKRHSNLDKSKQTGIVVRSETRTISPTESKNPGRVLTSLQPLNDTRSRWDERGQRDGVATSSSRDVASDSFAEVQMANGNADRGKCDEVEALTNFSRLNQGGSETEPERELLSMSQSSTLASNRASTSVSTSSGKGDQSPLLPFVESKNSLESHCLNSPGADEMGDSSWGEDRMKNSGEHGRGRHCKTDPISTHHSSPVTSMSVGGASIGSEGHANRFVRGGEALMKPSVNYAATSRGVSATYSSMEPTIPRQLVEQHGEILEDCSFKYLNGHQIVRVCRGDITKVSVDVVVNAANYNLKMSAGVSRAIARAAGRSVEEECKRFIRQHQSLSETGIFVSTGGKLCYRIIHAVGPMYYDQSKAKMQGDLVETFCKCLRECERLGYKSIAIPAISSGIHNAPKDVVAKALEDAVSCFCSAAAMTSILGHIHLVDIDKDQVRCIKACFKKSRNFWEILPKDVTGGYSLAGSQLRAHQSLPSMNQRASSANDAMNNAAYGSDIRQPRGKGDQGSATCPICLELPKKNEAVTLLKCKHVFCAECIEQSFKRKPTCPICGMIYGVLNGNQPENGQMTYHTETSTSLPGYEDFGTIIIQYQFPNGIQTEEHPHPGRWYTGTSRKAYLPDSREGRHVLRLLQKAFDARLTFTVGQSVTTGLTDQVTWNDIHHKTSMYSSSFGYPDPTYLDRVQDELAAKGIK